MQFPTETIRGVLSSLLVIFLLASNAVADGQYTVSITASDITTTLVIPTTIEYTNGDGSLTTTTISNADAIKSAASVANSLNSYASRIGVSSSATSFITVTPVTSATSSFQTSLQANPSLPASILYNITASSSSDSNTGHVTVGLSTTVSASASTSEANTSTAAAPVVSVSVMASVLSVFSLLAVLQIIAKI